jgi:hypothetical protein
MAAKDCKAMTFRKTQSAAKLPWLSITRGIILLLALYNMLPGIMGVPAHYTRLAALEPWPDRGGWNQANFTVAVEAAGMAPEAIAWLVLIPGLMGIFINLSLGMLILWWQSKDWMGLFAAYILLSLAGTFAGDNYQFLAALPPFWQFAARQWSAVNWLAFLLFLLLFPNGRLVPRWQRWVAAALAAWFVIFQITSEVWGKPPDLLAFVGLILLAPGLVGQALRYARYSSPIERQQIRWFVFAISIFIVFNIARDPLEGLFPLPVQPGASDLRNYLVLHYLSTSTFLLIPASISIAILRYRLWDIELVIRRTLMYTVLTALLGLVYLGLVTLLQSVFSGATGQTSPLALVISTLSIAALFNPLRRRVQHLIDRRFFRQQYDSNQALERFSHNLRNLADLPGVESELMNVVQETLQPDRVNLWLKMAASGSGSTNSTKAKG